MNTKKILLLTAPIGSGHRKAAEAVQEAIERESPSCTIKIIDVFDFLPKTVVFFCLKLYFNILTYLPCLYGQAYQWGNRSKFALLSRNMLSFLLSYPLKKSIVAFSPDAIVCTHASAASAVDYILAREDIRTYHVGVVTDFVIHRLWINDSIDDYFIYDETILNSVVHSLIEPRKIHAFGIPTRRQFGTYTNIEKCVYDRKRKTILCMGGGEGVLPMTDLLENLNKVNTPLRLIVLTGNNFKLKAKLERMQEHFKHSLQVEGFVDHVAGFMAQADLLVSKAGGISVSEALCMGLPMMIYCPLPGQEQANTHFLGKNNLILEIKHIDQLAQEIDKLFDDHEACIKWKNRLKKAAKPWAAEDIAKNILNKLYN